MLSKYRKPGDATGRGALDIAQRPVPLHSASASKVVQGLGAAHVGRAIDMHERPNELVEDPS